MRRYVEAIYEKGKLRLLEKLPLQEGERVTVAVHLAPPDYGELFASKQRAKGPRLVKLPNPRLT